jgi:hypothetical protein
MSAIVEILAMSSPSAGHRDAFAGSFSRRFFDPLEYQNQHSKYMKNACPLPAEQPACPAMSHFLILGNYYC